MGRISHSGLKPQEQAIMDLRERGMVAKDIAARLGINHRRVASVIGNFGDVELRDRGGGKEHATAQRRLPRPPEG